MTRRNPIEGMPGGSVKGCIEKFEDDPDIDDAGAYCAAIADRIEPGWRESNTGRQRNEILFDFRQTDVLVQGLQSLGLSKAKAKKIAEAYPDGRGLEDASTAALQELGATAAQAKRIRAAFEVVRVCDDSCEARVVGTSIRSPSDLVAVLRNKIGRREQEYFAVILLDARQRVMDVLGVAVGSLAEVAVSPREVFREAIRRNAHSVIVAHNHPTGAAEPSRADIDLTYRLTEVGRTVGIPVLDHLVVTRHGHESLAALGYVSSQEMRAAENPEFFVLTGRGISL